MGMDGEAAMVRDVVLLDDPLALTLGSIYAAAPTPPRRPPRTSPPPPPPPPPPPSSPARATRRRLDNSAPSKRRRSSDPRPDTPAPSQRRRSSEPRPDDVADGTPPPPPPFPWATGRPARHDTLESLLRRGITTVEGEARCKRCNCRATVAFDLEAKFREVREYVAANRHSFNDRAPYAWMNPALPDCEACGQDGCLWPAIPAEKGQINWLFLLLGQMLGCCTLEQLKYFCKNTGRHRTGAKNRVLYYAYLEMCKQIQPHGPFDDTVPANGNGFLHA